MAQLLNKIKIDKYEINQLFSYDCDNIDPYLSRKWKIDLDEAFNNKLYFVEYILLVFEKEISEDISLVVRVNGYDLATRRNYIFYNRILPLECENLYDTETNELLQNMVRNKDNDNLKKVLFFPFKLTTNGWLLDITPSDQDICYISRVEIILTGLPREGEELRKVHRYVKLCDKNSKNIDNLNYSHV